MDFVKQKHSKKAFLFCSLKNFSYMGEIENEGSFEKLAKKHERRYSRNHRGHYFVVVEGSPIYNEIQMFLDEHLSYMKENGLYTPLALEAALTVLYPDKISKVV